jgi:hypothetical protein
MIESCKHLRRGKGIESLVKQSARGRKIKKFRNKNEESQEDVDNNFLPKPTAEIVVPVAKLDHHQRSPRES